MKIKYTKGWNMISVNTPLNINEIDNVIPNTLYEYNNGSYNKNNDSMIFPNKGYWLRFSKDTEIDFDSQTEENTKIILKEIYNDIWTNCYMTNYDQSDSSGTTKKMTLYISRNYTMIINGNIGFFSYYTLNYPEIYLDMELSSLHSRQNFTKIIKTDDNEFWISKDALMMADNIMTYQINNEYGVKIGIGGEVNSGGWIKKVYSCWLPKTDDIQVSKYGIIYPTFIEGVEIDGIIYNNISEVPYGYRWMESQNILAYGGFKNGTTICHMRFLARVYKHTQINKYLNSFINGLNFIFNIYSYYGTFLYKPDTPGLMLPLNDGHFSNVCLLLLDISKNSNNEYSFIDNETKNKCITILDECVNFVIELQITDQITNKKTIWAQQYGTIEGEIIPDSLLPLKDPSLLAPIKAREFEPLALAGGESQSILLFLMNIENPNNNLILSIISAIEFYLENTIHKILYRGNKIAMNYNTDNYDIYLLNENNKSYKPIWSRLYNILTESDHNKFLEGLELYKDLEDNEKFEKIAIYIGHSTAYFFEKYYNRYNNNSIKLEPLYGDMDGTVTEDFNKLSYERRVGYTWHGSWPIFCIEKYLDWISNNLLNIINPNSELINIIVRCIEKLIQIVEDTEYKYYSDEEYSNFINQYSTWCESNGINPTGLNEIRIGLIGLGGRMTYLYQELLNSNNINIVSICDIQKSKIDNFVKLDGINNNINVYQNYNDMLNNENIDAVIISLPHHSNGLITSKCIDKGVKYIYEEKPFFWKINEGYELVNKVISNNIIIQIGSQLHSAKYFMDGVRLIRNNGIGEIDHIDFLIPWKPSNNNYSKNNEIIENNNLTHDLFNKWLNSNNNYISKNATENNNLLIKNNNSLLSGDWRDTIEYGGGLATAVGFHWWGFLFKCLNLTYSDYPNFKFIPSSTNQYLATIEIECPSKLNNKIIINYGFVEENADQEMKFYGSDGRWMKFNYITQVTTNVDIDNIIFEDTTLDYKLFEEYILDAPSSDTAFHINNWITAIRLGIKPNFPVEEAFYPNCICLIINSIYNINFTNEILWNSKNNIFETDNNEFEELINWTMYDPPENKNSKIIIENSDNFTINSLGNCIFDNEKYFLTFSVLENSNNNIYLADSNDTENWNYLKLIDNGLNPYLIKFNDHYYLYYLESTNILSCYKGTDLQNLSKIENINLSSGDFIINSYVIIDIPNKLHLLYKLSSGEIKHALSNDGINWIESNINLYNNEIINLSDIIYYNEVYYLSCICLSNNSLKVNDTQFSIKIFYSYDLDNWEDLLNQELILDNIKIDDKIIISDPYHSEDPENSDEVIIYNYGCKFFGNSNDITSSLLLYSSNGIIARY